LIKMSETSTYSAVVTEFKKTNAKGFTKTKVVIDKASKTIFS